MPNRTICAVLDAMRDCDKTKNYSYLLGLIEEAQNLANRMESKLYDLKDYEFKVKEYKALRKEVQKLKEEKENLGETTVSEG